MGYAYLCTPATMYLRRTGLMLALAFTPAMVKAAENVTLSRTVPSDAQTLDRNLISFSLEQDRWTDWVGTTSVNQVKPNHYSVEHHPLTTYK
jgi:hypothetical protein